MIATHTPKMFNAKLKSQALARRISGNVPRHLICSQTTDLRRELWASPQNAAELGRYQDLIRQLKDDYTLESFIPSLTDPNIKQVLLPLDWKNDKYVSVTPVPSMGICYEVGQRLVEQQLPYKRWVIQPNSVALANHGECLVKQGGAIRMMRRGLINLSEPEAGWTGDFVQLTARCEGLNISSGMVSIGFPAMTAIGGLVHALERQIGHQVEFAIGFKWVDWIWGLQKLATTTGSYGSLINRVKGKSVKVGVGYNTEEVRANCELALLLKTNSNNSKIKTALGKIHRLAGGQLFDVKIEHIKNGKAPKFNFLMDASENISDKFDSLDSALKHYAGDGEWVENTWKQSSNGYTINHTGYAFLETPSEKPASRNNGLHAWAEPIFSLITQSQMNDKCWWQRKNTDYGAIWEGNL